jgi:hypothetical protein
MKYQISPIPELPQEIIDAVNNHNLAVFIGAGVSRSLKNNRLYGMGSISQKFSQ